MLVIGPFLPVVRYLWSFSRSRQPLLRHWQFRPRKLATHPLPLSTWRYGAGHRNMCPGRWDIWVPPRPPEYALDTSHARERAMPTQQPTEESPDTAPLLRVLTAHRKGDWRTDVQH